MDDSLAFSIVNSLNTRIAVIDNTGVIRVVNDAWARFARENGDPLLEATGVGVNYLEATERSFQGGDPSAEKALSGIHAVLNGSRPQFELKYPCHSPTEDKWFLMRVTPLRGETGAVIAHIDITAQHFAARLMARTQRRKALAQEHVRQGERERAALVQMVDSAGDASTDQDAEGVDESALLERYSTLLDRALRRRAIGSDPDVTAEARAFAAALGRQTAGPRDLIRIHTAALEAAKRTSVSPGRIKIVQEEGRLLLLEVMGYLTAYYRDMILADLELKNM